MDRHVPLYRPPDASLAFVSIHRSFAKPPNDVPFYIQKLVIIKGDGPKRDVNVSVTDCQ